MLSFLYRSRCEHLKHDSKKLTYVCRHYKNVMNRYKLFSVLPSVILRVCDDISSYKLSLKSCCSSHPLSLKKKRSNVRSSSTTQQFQVRVRCRLFEQRSRKTSSFTTSVCSERFLYPDTKTYNALKEQRRKLILRAREIVIV